MSDLNFMITKDDSCSAENVERESLTVNGDQVTFRQYIPTSHPNENMDKGVSETGEEGMSNIYTSIVDKKHMGAIVALPSFELDETTSKLVE